MGEGARVDHGTGDETIGDTSSSSTAGGVAGDDVPGTEGTEGGPTSLTNADDDEGMGPAECGNGQLDLDELCDDGNEIDADGCNNDCVHSGMVVWQETVGSAAMQVDEGFAIVADSDGNFFVSGYTAIAAGTVDGWLRRFSPEGGAYWTVTLQGAVGNDAFQGMSLTDTEGVYIAGYTTAADMTYDAWVRAVDRFGGEQWTSTFDAPGATATVITRVATDPDGALVVVGYHDTLANGQNILVRKYSVDGMAIWTRSYDGPALGNDYGYGIEVTEDGHIYVTGTESVPGEASNMWLGNYDVDGNLIWSRSYNGTLSLDDYLMDVAVDPAGNAYVCGYSAAVDYPWHVFVRRYDPDGEIVWTDEYPGAMVLGAHCSGIGRDPTGDIVIAGGEMRDQDGTPVRDALVRKYSADGDEKWTTRVPGGVAGPDYGRDVYIDGERLVYAVGSIDTGTDARDIWIARLTP